MNDDVREFMERVGREIPDWMHVMTSDDPVCRIPRISIAVLATHPQYEHLTADGVYAKVVDIAKSLNSAGKFKNST